LIDTDLAIQNNKPQVYYKYMEEFQIFPLD